MLQRRFDCVNCLRQLHSSHMRSRSTDIMTDVCVQVPPFHDAASSKSSLSSVESALPGHDRLDGKTGDSVYVPMDADSSSRARWAPVATPSGLAALNVQNESTAPPQLRPNSLFQAAQVERSCEANADQLSA